MFPISIVERSIVDICKGLLCLLPSSCDEDKCRIVPNMRIHDWQTDLLTSDDRSTLYLYIFTSYWHTSMMRDVMVGRMGSN